MLELSDTTHFSVWLSALFSVTLSRGYNPIYHCQDSVRTVDGMPPNSLCIPGQDRSERADSGKPCKDGATSVRLGGILPLNSLDTY